MGSWGVPRHSINKLRLLAQFSLYFLCNILAEIAVSFVADDGVGAGGHKNAKQAIDYAVCSQLILVSPLITRMQAKTECAANIQTE